VPPPRLGRNQRGAATTVARPGRHHDPRHHGQREEYLTRGPGCSNNGSGKAGGPSGTCARPAAPSRVGRKGPRCPAGMAGTKAKGGGAAQGGSQKPRWAASSAPHPAPPPLSPPTYEVPGARRTSLRADSRPACSVCVNSAAAMISAPELGPPAGVILCSYGDHAAGAGFGAARRRCEQGAMHEGANVGCRFTLDVACHAEIQFRACVWGSSRWLRGPQRLAPPCCPSGWPSVTNLALLCGVHVRIPPGDGGACWQLRKACAGTSWAAGHVCAVMGSEELERSANVPRAVGGHGLRAGGPCWRVFVLRAAAGRGGEQGGETPITRGGQKDPRRETLRPGALVARVFEPGDP